MPFLSRLLPTRRALLTLGPLLLIATRAANAAWPSNPLQNVSLCVTPFSSQIRSTVTDQRGGAIAVWYEDRFGDFDVFARRVDSGGTPRWSADGVPVCVTTPRTSQVLPRAVIDGSGGAIVVWVDNRTGPNALYAQHVDSSGVRQWSDGGVLLASTTSNQVAEFCVVSDGAGGAMVAWATPVSGVSSDIYAQHVNATGALQCGANAKALCTNRLDQVHPTLVRKNSGTFVVAWEDQRATFSTFVYGQALTGTGTTSWARDGILLAGSGDNAINPMLVATADDDCLLVWDADSLGVGDIRAQRLGTTGAPQWAGAGLRMFPAGVSGVLGVAADSAGGTFVVAGALDNASHKNVLLAQRVRSTGVLACAATGMRVSGIPSNQVQPAVAPDNVGGLLVTWFDDQGRTPPSLDIVAQRLSPAGKPVWYASGVPVCRAPNAGDGLALAASGSGAVIAWSDTRNGGGPDICAQGVDALGRLGTGVGVEPPSVPTVLALACPAPNPAPHGATSIAYTLASSERVRLRVVDPSGRVVSVLEDGVSDAGTHTVAWDGRANGRELPPGLYLVQLVTPTRSEVRRLVLL